MWNRFQNSTRRLVAVSALGLTAMLAGTAAHAGGVSWNIGINLPGPAVVVGSYGPPPVAYYPPAPVVYAPAPVVYAPPPPVYVVPQPRVVYAPPAREWCPPRHVGWRQEWREGREGRHHRDWDDDRRGYRQDAYGYGYR